MLNNKIFNPCVAQRFSGQGLIYNPAFFFYTARLKKKIKKNWVDFNPVFLGSMVSFVTQQTWSQFFMH